MAMTVALQRCLTILLLLYVLAAAAALLAGATIVAHVDPFSECILFSSQNGDKLYYGHEASELGQKIYALQYLLHGCILNHLKLGFVRCFP